ncbi:hypothetical protein Droror1_Dr00006440 [Drosera rotundifolia]
MTTIGKMKELLITTLKDIAKGEAITLNNIDDFKVNVIIMATQDVESQNTKDKEEEMFRPMLQKIIHTMFTRRHYCWHGKLGAQKRRTYDSWIQDVVITCVESCSFSWMSHFDWR